MPIYNPGGSGGGGGGGFTMPAGAMMQFGGPSAPSGWLLCDGSAVSRTTYSALFAAIGAAYGPGNGSSTFNLPNFADNVAMGAGGMLGVGQLTGAATTTAATAGHTHTMGVVSTAGITSGGDNSAITQLDANTGAATDLVGPFSIIQPSLGVNFIIKT